MHKKKIVQTCFAAVLAIVPLSQIHAARAGAIHTQKGTFTFAPSVCAVYKEGETYDIEVYGPGVSPGGEKVFVNFSSTAQALDINFGVDSVFASADMQFLSQGDLHVQVDGRKVRVEAISLHDQNRQLVDTDVTLEIDCS